MIVRKKNNTLGVICLLLSFVFLVTTFGLANSFDHDLLLSEDLYITIHIIKYIIVAVFFFLGCIQVNNSIKHYWFLVIGCISIVLLIEFLRVEDDFDFFLRKKKLNELVDNCYIENEHIENRSCYNGKKLILEGDYHCFCVNSTFPTIFQPSPFYNRRSYYFVGQENLKSFSEFTSHYVVNSVSENWFVVYSNDIPLTY